MRVTSEQPLEFRFHWLNDQGQQQGFLRKKGSFDGETLALDDVEIPAAAIAHVESRDNRMAMTAMTADGKPATVMLMPATRKDTDRIKTALDIARSDVWAKMHRDDLVKQGRGHAYRDAQCPQCGATLILTDFPQTPQLFCRFCQALSTVSADADPAPGEQHLRICDECGMFSKPRRFTIFYFYFLLVAYGYRYRMTWRCPACMRGDAWKMLFGNLIFVLGVPVALTQLFRSYGGTDFAGPFKGLDAGNIRARKGDFGGALDQYRAILERVPCSAGINYNLGLALRHQGDAARAADAFAAALENCSNYTPAYAHLRELYADLGETRKLTQLNEIWGETDEEEAPPDAQHAIPMLDDVEFIDE